MALGEEVLGSTILGVDKMLSSAVPLNTKQIDHEIDLSVLPADTIVDFELEISENAGVDWRILGGASVRVGDRIVGKPSGIGVSFPNGNSNPDFMVRTIARVRGSAVAVPGVMTERINKTALGDQA